MSRFDLTGFFWDDYVAPKVPVEKVVRTPPHPFWLDLNYLPGLAEAKAYEFDLLSDNELIAEVAARNRFVWDTEFYPNYVLIGAKSIVTNKILKFEFHHGEQLLPIEADKLRWFLERALVIGFNDNHFDIPMMVATLAGLSLPELMKCVGLLIHGGDYENGVSAYQFYKITKLKPFPVNNIDLIELTPGGPSLKLCAGRIHAKRMADLPFQPEKPLTNDQKLILRHYWVNDLENTHALYDAHGEAIKLREALTEEYKVDVRSKSDPQIAEEVIRTEIRRMTKKRIVKATIRSGDVFTFQAAPHIQFKTPFMKSVLKFVKEQLFTIDDLGSPQMSEALSKLVIQIGETEYKLGMGGLHSKEKKTFHVSNDRYELTDNDVTSYYPSLILQQGMFPPNVGPAFLKVFERIYHRRLAAKEAGIKTTSETLKIVLNGTFGKTGERGGHSVVYYPEMMVQVTVSGQLSLLMLIEALELAGIQVVSANTDGIVIKCPVDLIEVKAQIIAEWSKQTGLGLESVGYKSILSKDVNNYIAFYSKPKKDVAKRIGAYREILGAYPLKWNPTCDVCSNAAVEFLATGKPVDEYIREEKDFRRFIEVRQVRGGAVKGEEYLGKNIRWYYSTDSAGEIINAKNGHIVPRSQGAKPCMILPDEFPEDIDYAAYTERALGILRSLSAID